MNTYANIVQWKIRACWMIVILLMVPACANPGKMSEEMDETTASQADLPEDFMMTMGMEGGFAGRSEGYTITREGKVTHWEGKYPGENVKRESQLSSDEMASLWQHISSAKFFDQNKQEQGNMTNFINVLANGKAHRVTWVRALGEQAQGSPLEALYDMCQDMVTESFGEKM